MSKDREIIRKRQTKRCATKDADIMDDFWLWIINNGKFTPEHDAAIEKRQAGPGGAG